MMKTHIPVASLCLGLCLVAVACTDESQNATLLVGEWSDCEDAEDTFVFASDGSFAFDETCTGEGCSEDHITGSYSAGDTSVSVAGTDQDGVAVTMDFSYYANDTHMALGAAYPQGSHEGIVGTWQANLRVEGDGDIFGSTTTMELRADGTGSMTQVPHDGSETLAYDGTWGPDEDENNVGGYELTMPQDENFTISVSFQLIDDAVIGTPRYCRVAAP
jgi:hypothetical protein